MSSAIRWMRGTLFAASIVVICGTAAQAQGKWVKVAPFPEPSQEIVGTAGDGKVFVFGGLPIGPNKTPKGLSYEYDVATNKWIKHKRMPLPAHHLAVTYYRGRVYIFGGGAQVVPGGPNWVPINNSWEYNPNNDTWKALPPMPTARGAAVAAAVDGKIYVIGGASVHPGMKIRGLNARVPQQALSTNEAFDLKTQTWEERAPMPTARNHMAVGVVDGKIYVLGGRVGSVFVNASPTDVVEEYDPATNSWGYARARMPTPRSGTAYGVYDGKIYVAGGEYLNNEVVGVWRDLQAYDPATDSWSILPDLPTPRHGLVGGVTDGRFFVVSGHMQSGNIFGDVMDSPEVDAFVFNTKKSK